MLTRRGFLQSSSLLALAPSVPLFLARTAEAAGMDKDGRVLVVIQLDGGNDALNTVIPYADAQYARLRPQLRIAANNLVKLSDAIGLHPSLTPLQALLHDGELAVIPGVGYPNPNRSHFDSMAIWQTAWPNIEEQPTYGWLGRALDRSAGTSFVLDDSLPRAVLGRRSAAVTMNRLEDVTLADPAAVDSAAGTSSSGDLLAFVQQQIVDARATAGRLANLARGDGPLYPTTKLGERLKLASQLLKADLGARVVYTRQSGYDTHASQRFVHANLLSEFADAVAAFFRDLRAAKLAERVALLAFSEFGRTIRENNSAGTDHGTAGVVLLAGHGVRGGLHGSMPSLTDLVDGEPKFTTDFRRIYASVLTEWLNETPNDVLAPTFEPLLLFRPASHGMPRE